MGATSRIKYVMLRKAKNDVRCIKSTENKEYLMTPPPVRKKFKKIYGRAGKSRHNSVSKNKGEIVM